MRSLETSTSWFLTAHASEQGNVIGLVSVYIYIYMSSKKIVIERTRDLIYLKFVATDFSLKISSPSTGENSGDSAYPLLFCSFCLVDELFTRFATLPHPLPHSADQYFIVSSG